jgi:hypothetical protein
VRAASALMPTLTDFRSGLCSHECEHGTHECVRHVFFIQLDGPPAHGRSLTAAAR